MKLTRPTVFSTLTCAFCKQVEYLLEKKGIKYDKIMLDNDLETRNELHKITGATTVPITYIGGKFYVGWTPKLIQAINSYEGE